MWKVLSRLSIERLRETGLVHDEGPDKDGGVGPATFRASVRLPVFTWVCENALVEKGRAYYCFCTQERLDS